MPTMRNVSKSPLALIFTRNPTTKGNHFPFLQKELVSMLSNITKTLILIFTFDVSVNSILGKKNEYLYRKLPWLGFGKFLSCLGRKIFCEKGHWS